MKNSGEQEWEKYWVSHEKSLFGKASRFYRKYILSHYVKRILDLHFTVDGFFLDCGSGSSESSMRLQAADKKYLALDTSYYAVRRAVGQFVNLRGIIGDILFDNLTIRKILPLMEKIVLRTGMKTLDYS